MVLKQVKAFKMPLKVALGDGIMQKSQALNYQLSHALFNHIRAFPVQKTENQTCAPGRKVRGFVILFDLIQLCY